MVSTFGVHNNVDIGYVIIGFLAKAKNIGLKADVRNYKKSKES